MPNRVVNGGFETDTAGWTPARATLTRDTARRRFGTASGRVNVTAADGVVYVISSATERIPAVAGETLPLLASVWSTQAGRTFAFMVYEYDSAGALLTPTNSIEVGSAAAGAWSDFVASVTLKAGTASVRVGVSVTAGAAVGDSWWVDGIALGVNSLIGLIDADFDPALARVGVTLTDLPSDAPVTLYREGPGGRVPVRGAEPIVPLGGTAFVWDYEFPWNVGFSYVADVAGVLIRSDVLTLGESRAWLRAPGLPFLDHPVVPDRVPALTRARPSATLRPLGRSRPVVVSDVLQSPEGSIGFLTTSDEEADALLEIVASSPVVLLQMPGTRFGERYVALGDVEEIPATGYADDPGATFQIPFVVVDRPVGGLFGDPANSYDVVRQTFPTYAALLAAEKDYLDLLQGVATG